jgi:hypothetical protein
MFTNVLLLVCLMYYAVLCHGLLVIKDFQIIWFSILSILSVPDEF